jgi:glutathione S-transferase
MKLYEFAPTRTIRVRWTLQELAVDMATTAKVLNGLPRLEAYLEEMYARPRAPMRIAAAFASIRR